MNKFYSILKIFVLFLLIIINSISTVNAQQYSGDFWNSVRFGGSVGLSFGDGFFSGTLSPSAIYEFNNHVALGLGLNGTYNTQKDVYKSTILGGSVIGLFSPISNIQLSAEFEQLHVNRRFNNALNIQDDTYWSPALFTGIGYTSGPVTFGVRYDLLYDESKSIYADAWAPFVRFYF